LKGKMEGEGGWGGGLKMDMEALWNMRKRVLESTYSKEERLKGYEGEGVQKKL
jgi:hypothetical protein